MSNNNEASRPKIEVRSIDYVPRHERHGKVWHQAPFWFTGNFVLTTMVTGFTGPALGLGALYSILAIVLGVCFGTFFMAFHANQGPRMGLPQMIQSRAQFGLRGAIVPFAAVVFVYIGFNVFNVILATDAINTVLPGHRAPWYVLLIGVAVLLAIVGHDLLHTVQRWLTYVMIAVFGVLTVSALRSLEADAALGGTPAFSWSAFLVQLSAAAGYQISYAVYVSDYSRYLPHETPTRKVIFWTYLGAAGSALWLMSLGAFLASALPAPDAIGSVREVGNRLYPGFGTFTVLIAVPALVGIMAVNCYGAMLTSLSAIDAFRKGHSDPQPARHRDRRDRPGGIRRGPVDPGKLPGQLQHLRPADAVLPGALDRGQPGGLLLRAQRSLRDQRNLQSRRHLRSLGPTGVERLPGRVAGDGPVHVPELLQRSLRRGAGRRRRRLRGRPAGGRRGLCLHVPGPGPGGGTTARHPRRAPAGRGGA